MGYESKIIVGYRNHFACRVGRRDYCQKIMILDLSKMGDDRFSNYSNKLFNKELDFDLYKDDGNTLYEKDAYGDVCKYTSLNNVIKVLKEINETCGHYRRADLALKALKAFNKKDWCWKDKEGYGELVVVHYGY